MVFTCCNFSDNSAVVKNFGQFFLREKCANDCRCNSFFLIVNII